MIIKRHHAPSSAPPWLRTSTAPERLTKPAARAELPRSGDEMRSRQIWTSAVSGAPAGTIARAAWEAACAVYLMRDAIRQALRSYSEVISDDQRSLVAIRGHQLSLIHI